MDKDWFKMRMRQSGATTETLATAINRDRAVVSRILNGKQELKPQQAEVFAEVLDVGLDEVLAAAGMFENKSKARRAVGFSEGDAAPFDITSSKHRKDAAIAKDLGCDKSGVDVWQVKGRAMALAGYIEGDRMLVDVNAADQCKAGDVVIAQVYDWETGSANTVLRRFSPPVLTSASTNPDDQKVHVVDGSNVALRGKIIASWRI